MDGREVALAAAALAAAGTAVTAYGSYRQGQAAEATAEHNVKVEALEREAVSKRQAQEAARQRLETLRLLSRQRALQPTSGLALAGSFADVAGESARMAELDALAIRYGGNLARTRSRNRAALELFGGKQAKIAGTISAGASLLEGGSAAAGAWGDYARAANRKAPLLNHYGRPYGAKGLDGRIGGGV